MPLRKASNVSCDTKSGLFSTSYEFHYKKWVQKVSEKEFKLLVQAKTHGPVVVMSTPEQTVWWVGSDFYIDGDRLSAEEVSLILWDRQRKHERKLERLRQERTAVEEVRDQARSGRRSRISAETKRVVFERDDGACVRCGASSELQFDHVIPVSRGGASSVANLQILCGPCNREKSDSID